MSNAGTMQERIISTLQEGPISLKELTERTELTERQIRRAVSRIRRVLGKDAITVHADGTLHVAGWV